MRKLFLLASLLICLTCVNAFAQDTSGNAKTENEKRKNSIDQAVEEARERGETIIESCLVDCEDAAVREGFEPGKILSRPQPPSPPIARAAHATGTVEVKVIVDVDGKVIAAAAIKGHPLLQGAAVSAARYTTFTPAKYNGEPVKVVGVITYTFQ
jgi:TonB family protein